MTNYVVLNDGTDYGTEKGKLTPIVQGQLITLIIDVRDAANNDFDITGATAIAARMNLKHTTTTTTASGTITASGGGLSWDVSSADVGTDGRYSVIFQFVLSGDTYKTHPVELYIIDDPAVTDVQGSAAATWALNSEANLAAGTADNLASFDADGVLEDSGIAAAGVLDSSDIGVTIQGYDADTAKLDLNQSWSGSQNLQDNQLIRPVLKDYSEALNNIGDFGGGTQNIDLTLGNVVLATVSTSTVTFTFGNPPASGTAGSFTLILTNGGGQTVNWPAGVSWAGGTVPTLTSGGLDILTFITTSGGASWFGFAAGLNMQ